MGIQCFNFLKALFTSPRPIAAAAIIRSATAPLLLVCLALTPYATHAQELLNGVKQEGTILLNQTNSWTFSARTGDTVIIRSGRTGGDVNFNPWLRIFDPSGTLVESNPIGNATIAVELSLTAQATGTYTLLVSDGTFGRSDDRGTYRLTFIKLPGSPAITDDGGPLQNGGNSDGTITVGDLDTWTFPGKVGDRIVLRSGKLTGSSGFNPWVRLFDPAGKLMEDTGSANSGVALELALSLESEGTYTVVVTDSTFGGADETGTYRLILTRFPEALTIADDGGPLRNGGNHAGTITVGDLDPWTFTAQTGDLVVLRCSRLDGLANFNPWMRLYDPSGQLVEDTGREGIGTVAELSINAMRTGTFTLLLGDGISGGLGREGSYRLNYVRIPGTVADDDDGTAMTNGLPVSASITLGDLDARQFYVCRGSELSIRLDRLTDISSFDPRLELFGPNGVRLISVISGASTEFSLIATNSGVYTLLVKDSSSGGLEGSGNYLLTSTGILDDKLQLCQPIINQDGLDLAGMGGTPNAEFVIYNSTTLERPKDQWLPVLTNRFDSTGTFDLTKLPYPQGPQRYYYLIQR